MSETFISKSSSCTHGSVAFIINLCTLEIFLYLIIFADCFVIISCQSSILVNSSK